MKPGGGKLLELTAGGVRWQVVPECRDLLFGPEGLQLEEWLTSGLAQVVKHGPHRTVYRIVLPGLSFYLKHFRLPDLRAWLRQLVRPAKARMEFVRALAVAERRVSTVIPMALGERCAGRGPNESFLITRTLEDTAPLGAFIEETWSATGALADSRLRQQLARALGDFVGRLHNAGIVHHDLHAANLLVRREEDEEPHIYLIDLHAVKIGPPVYWAAARDNLAMLNRWFVLRASRTDRLRFWKAYCRTRLIQDRGLHAARNLEERTLHSNLSFWSRRDRRCLATNRYYYRIREAGISGHAVRDVKPSDLARLLADPDAPFRQQEIPLLKDSRSSTVAEFDLIVQGKVQRVIYKRFCITSWKDPLTSLFRRSAALHSWVCGQGLRERCLPTARPLAVFHRRRVGLAFEGYLLTEKISDAVDLHGFVSRLERLDAAERRSVLHERLEQVAVLIRDLHRRQVSHRDLKAANLLVTDEAVWLIDLVGVTFSRRLSRGRRTQNIARLHASFHQSAALTRTDKLRFLRAYLQWGLFGKTGWKRWWRDIEQATCAKIARNRRSGRLLY